MLPPVYDPRGRSELSGLLASLLSSEGDETQIVLPRVVCEYSDVIPEDLAGLCNNPHH